MKERAASWRAAAERVRAALYDEKKRVNLLLCAGLAGLLLLAFSEWLPDSTSQEQSAAAVPHTSESAGLCRTVGGPSAGTDLPRRRRRPNPSHGNAGAGRRKRLCNRPGNFPGRFFPHQPRADRGRGPGADHPDAAGPGGGCHLRRRRKPCCSKSRMRPGRIPDRCGRQPYHRSQNGAVRIKEA